MADKKKPSKDAKAKAENPRVEDAQTIADEAQDQAVEGVPAKDHSSAGFVLTDADVAASDEEIPTADADVIDDAHTKSDLAESKEPDPADMPNTTERKDSSATEMVPDDASDDMAKRDQEIQDDAVKAVEPENIADMSPQMSPVVPPEQVVVQKGGFFPTVLGGLVAGAIGFGASQFLMSAQSDDGGAIAAVKKQLEKQSGALNALDTSVQALSAGSDLEEIRADFEASIGSMTDRIAALEGQLAEIARAPVGDAGVSGAAFAAMQRELQELQAALENQRTTIDKISQLVSTEERNAESAAQATLRRAALTRVQTALDAGLGFAPALADLEATGVSVPAALGEVAENGVPSLTALTESYPAAGRAALEASRAASEEAGESSGLGSFLRNQLGARSLEPREGNDPDAVLSRVEAATREGRLMDALAEIEALPEAGRAELSEWSGQVARRLKAVTAAQELGEKLN